MDPDDRTWEPTDVRVILGWAGQHNGGCVGFNGDDRIVESLVLLRLLAEHYVVWVGETLETRADHDAVMEMWMDMYGMPDDLSDLMDEVTADRVDLWVASFAADGFEANAIGDFPDDAKSDAMLMRHHAELLFESFPHDLRKLGRARHARPMVLAAEGRQRRGHAQRRR